MPTLQSALTRAITATGQTAVYSAVAEGLDYVKKGHFDRRVLIVVSDGGDNASSTTRAQVLASAQASNAVIYTVALVDPLDTEADPGFLAQLSDLSGGQAFRPKNIDAVGNVLQRIALDIRNMYTLGYVPASTSAAKKRTAPPCERRCRSFYWSEIENPHASRVSERRRWGRDVLSCALTPVVHLVCGSIARLSRLVSRACCFMPPSPFRPPSINAKPRPRSIK